MKELKRTKTIEETYGYEAFDGSYFSSAEACREYEQSADAAIIRMATPLRTYDNYVDATFECFCGEDHVTVWDIKDVDGLRIINQLIARRDRWSKTPPAFTADVVGSRVAAVMGEEWVHILGTREDMMRDCQRILDKIFADPTPKADPTTKADT